MIGITKSGRWITGDAATALESGKPESAPLAALLPDPELSELMELQVVASQPARLSAVTTLDVVFPVLHGPYGEDGTVQGLLELAGIPYVGAGVVGSATGMDKAIFKSVMSAHGIAVLPWKLVLASDWRAAPDEILDDIERSLRYPMFTKPANLGSSVGIQRCEDRLQLQAGLDEAATYDRRLIVEQGINARELEVSVLGNDKPQASVVGEIKPRRRFYDYVAKYVSDDSDLEIPADISSALSDQIRNTAILTYKAIDCAGLARVDFLLDKDDGQLYINELNTIPGFTRISMYPKLWQASGLSYSELLDRLVELALERSAVKAKLETTYQVQSDD
jgi:D-alanine-D-alanine ligase